MPWHEEVWDGSVIVSAGLAWAFWREVTRVTSDGLSRPGILKREYIGDGTVSLLMWTGPQKHCGAACRVRIGRGLPRYGAEARRGPGDHRSKDSASLRATLASVLAVQSLARTVAHRPIPNVKQGN